MLQEINGVVDRYPRTQPNFLSLPDVSQFLSKDSQPLQVKVSKPVIIYQGGADRIVPKEATDFSCTSQIRTKLQYVIFTDEVTM